MKKLAIIALILLNISFLSSAQTDTLKKSKIAKTSIILGGGNEMEGILYQIKDSSVLLTNSKSKRDFLNANFDLSTINYNIISSITVMKKKYEHKTLAGIVIGTAIGAIAGAVTGAIKYSRLPADHPAKSGFLSALNQIDYAKKGGVIGLVIGAGTGAFVTNVTVEIKIPIYGNFDKFNKNKSRLKQYSYMH